MPTNDFGGIRGQLNSLTFRLTPIDKVVICQQAEQPTMTVGC